MENVDEISLRRLAARFLSTDEEDGLHELDGIIRGTYCAAILRYALSWLAFYISSILILLLICDHIQLLANGEHDRNVYNMLWSLMLVAAFFAAAGPLGWRWYQYGIGWSHRKRSALYPGSANKASVANLEKFFDTVGKEAVQVYFSKNGNTKNVSRKIFLGVLRPLLLAEDDYMRGLVFYPLGLWFDRQLMIKANAEEWVRKAKAKPRSGGDGVDYDYQAILEDLIGDPELAKLDPNQHGAMKKIEDIIRVLNMRRRKLPRQTQMGLFTRRINDHIKKNRELRRKLGR
jgi:hypothetical protein